MKRNAKSRLKHLVAPVQLKETSESILIYHSNIESQGCLLPSGSRRKETRWIKEHLKDSRRKQAKRLVNIKKSTA